MGYQSAAAPEMPTHNDNRVNCGVSGDNVAIVIVAQSIGRSDTSTECSVCTNGRQHGAIGITSHHRRGSYQTGRYSSRVGYQDDASVCMSSVYDTSHGYLYYHY